MSYDLNKIAFVNSPNCNWGWRFTYVTKTHKKCDFAGVCCLKSELFTFPGKHNSSISWYLKVMVCMTGFQQVTVRTVYIYRWTQFTYLVLIKGNGMHDWVSAIDGVLDFILTPKTCDVFLSKIEDKKGGFGGSYPSNSSENFEKKYRGTFLIKVLSLKFG